LGQPGLSHLIDLFGFFVLGGEWRGDPDPDDAWLLDESMSGPSIAGGVSHDQDGGTDRVRQCGAADLKRTGRSDRNPCPLRKQHDPDIVGDALPAFADERSQRSPTISAVDGDRLQQAERPAEERYVQQLAFDQCCLGCEQRLNEECLPGALVLHEDDARVLWNVLETLDFVTDAAAHAQPCQHESRPDADDELKPGPERDQPRDQDRQ